MSLKIKIGNIKIDNAVMLAPMAGVTDLPMRQMVRKYGSGLLFAEMMASSVTTADNIRKKRRDYVDFSDEYPLAVQIIGYDANMIADAAKIITDRGAAIIDINFGCPAKKIVNKYCGSALMRDEKLAADIMEKTVKATHLPVTVKMRLGWDNENLNALNICKIAENSGVQIVTIHARTRAQLFSGTADWKKIAEIKDKINIPIIANGDIISAEKAQQALATSNADGIMIARGIYGKPWLLQQIIEYLNESKITTIPNNIQIIKDAIEHYNLILEHYGERTGIPLARKHLSWYLENIDGSSDISNKIKILEDSQTVIKILQEYQSNFI